MIFFAVSAVGFVWTAARELSDINIVESIACAQYNKFPTILWRHFLLLVSNSSAVCSLIRILLFFPSSTRSGVQGYGESCNIFGFSCCK